MTAIAEHDRQEVDEGWWSVIWKNLFVFIFSVPALDLDLGSSVQPESGASCRFCWSWSEISSDNILDLSVSHLSRVSIFCRSQSWEWRLGSPSVLVFFSSLSLSDRPWELSLSLLHSSWSLRAHIVHYWLLWLGLANSAKISQSNTAMDFN